MTNKEIILSELEKIKGTTFTYGDNVKREIVIDFEIKELRENELTIHIDKTLTDFWRIYWHLKMDGGLEELKIKLKENNINHAIIGNVYVDENMNNYGKLGCMIQIIY